MTLKLLYDSWVRMEGKENDDQQYRNALHLCSQRTQKYVLKSWNSARWEATGKGEQ
jgi:hypothetical protein